MGPLAAIAESGGLYDISRTPQDCPDKPGEALRADAADQVLLRARRRTTTFAPTRCEVQALDVDSSGRLSSADDVSWRHVLRAVALVGTVVGTSVGAWYGAFLLVQVVASR